MATDRPIDKTEEEVYVNVEADPRRRDEIVAQSRSWTAPKLVALTIVTLAIAFAGLWGASYWTGTWGRTIDYPNFLMPESPDSMPAAQRPAYR